MAFGQKLRLRGSGSGRGKYVRGGISMPKAGSQGKTLQVYSRRSVPGREIILGKISEDLEHEGSKGKSRFCPS